MSCFVLSTAAQQSQQPQRISSYYNTSQPDSQCVSSLVLEWNGKYFFEAYTNAHIHSSKHFTIKTKQIPNTHTRTHISHTNEMRTSSTPAKTAAVRHIFLLRAEECSRISLIPICISCKKFERWSRFVQLCAGTWIFCHWGCCGRLRIRSRSRYGCLLNVSVVCCCCCWCYAS